MKRTLAHGPLLLLAACASPHQPFDGQLIDLTHPFDEETIYWPTAKEGFVLTVDAEGWTEKGYYYEANSFRSAEHGGTHLDAPIHFAEGKHATDEIPLERLLGPGVRIDVREACAQDSDYRVRTEDFLAWEARHGVLPKGAIVLLHTGFGKRWPDRERYLGTAELGPDAVPKLHFPGLHPEAARFLVEERDISSIGLDTPSIDYGQSTHFEAHRILFERDVPAFENLANLELLPEVGFHVVALPMKIRGGSGGPLRAIAIVP